VKAAGAIGLVTGERDVQVAAIFGAFQIVMPLKIRPPLPSFDDSIVQSADVVGATSPEK
jgi:hypothetical protein